MTTDPTRLWPEIAADALDECNELRGLLREALPGLRAMDEREYEEHRWCRQCGHYDGHRADCLVKRIEEVLQ